MSKNRNDNSRGFSRSFRTEELKKAKLDSIDYKHPELLKSAVTPMGRITPRRIASADSKVSAKKQRAISQEIKKIRFLAIKVDK